MLKSTVLGADGGEGGIPPRPEEGPESPNTPNTPEAGEGRRLRDEWLSALGEFDSSSKALFKDAIAENCYWPRVDSQNYHLSNKNLPTTFFVMVK